MAPESLRRRRQRSAKPPQAARLPVILGFSFTSEIAWSGCHLHAAVRVPTTNRSVSEPRTLTDGEMSLCTSGAAITHNVLEGSLCSLEGLIPFHQGPRFFRRSAISRFCVI